MSTTSTSGMSSPAPSAARAGIGSPVLAAAPHRIGAVTLVVSDLETVAAFYRGTLGLAEREREPGRVALGTASETLLVLKHDPGARRRSPREAGLFHTAFLLPRRADLGAWIAHASERRVQIQGASDHAVSEAIYLADPEGNGIEIYVDRPHAAWPVSGGTIDMPSEPLDLRAIYESGLGTRWAGYPDGAIVGHMHLQVGAIPPAERFYGELLGFSVTCRYPGGSFYGSGGYHHQLATNIWNSRGATPRRDTATGLEGFELVVTDAAVAAAAAGRLAAAGFDVSRAGDVVGTVDPWGTRVTLVPAT